MSHRDFQPAAIPCRLRDLSQWVCWKAISRRGKPTKCPFNARTGQRANTTDASTWSSFVEAEQACKTGKDYAGVGFVFAADGPYCGVDIDDCIESGTGQLKPWARQIVDRLNSYTEVSPSGTGVKVFLRAAKPGKCCRKAYGDGEIEIYDAGRYFTVTTRRLDGVSEDVEDRTPELTALYAEIFGEDGPARRAPAEPAAASLLSDDEIIKKASNRQKFSDLWSGRWDRYPSQSEADASMVFMLAYYTKDAAQIDRIFRRSELMRPKWDELHGEKTYGAMTIAKALEKVTSQYKPRTQKQKCRASAAASRSSPSKDLPPILISNIQLGDLTAQGLSALHAANEPPVLFVRAGSLCRIICDENDRPAVEDIDKLSLRARLADVAEFSSINKEGKHIAQNPPLYLAENILAQGRWDFPPLVGVARSPILRRDGTICVKPGYDADSRLYYCCDPDLIIPPVPENPSEQEVRAAKEHLLDLIDDFPFPDAAGIPNALAILLSILMRPVITGHVPLAIVDAPAQGTGKTLLVTVLGIVGVGTVSAESVPDRQNDDEWRKKITSLLLKGPPLVLLDNIPDNATIDAAPLAALLTADMWSDRLLSKNDIVELPARSIWVATGNNVRVAGDMPRRCYTIRMDANSERPWTRTRFRHADLQQYALANRGQLLASAFTLIRSWFAAGKPQASVPAFGSFQEWTATIGGVLAHVGIEGFLGNYGDVREVQDEDTLQWQAFFAAWWDHFSSRAITVDDMTQHILSKGTLLDGSLPDALLLNKYKGDGAFKRSLGRSLSHLEGRIFGGRKLRDAGTDSHRKVRVWRLSPTDEPLSLSLTPITTHDPASDPAEGDAA